MTTETHTPPLRVHHLLSPWIAAQPDALALRDASVSLSYGELGAQMDATARRLAQAGVRAGDRVLIVGENCAALCVVFLALSKLDAWTVAVNARLSAREIDAFIAHAGARRVLYLCHVSPEARGHAQRHGASHLAGELGELGEVAIGPLSESTQPEPCEADPAAQVAAMVYTSGTTGAPKGVMLTHANLMFVATAARDLRRLGPRDVVYGVLPMAHVVGLSTQFLGAMCAGAALLLEPRFAPENAARALQRDGVTVFTGVPALFARLLEWARKSGHDGKNGKNGDSDRGGVAIEAPALRLITVAGSPLTPRLKAEVEQAFGLPLHNGYGLTETGPTVAQTRLDAPREDCAVGVLIPRVQAQVRVVNAGDGVAGAGTGVSAGPGEVGELWVRGPGVMKGYYRSPELTAAVIDAAGWFNTGDLARIDADGALFISGRTKELIIRSGFNVYPLEVEQVLNAYPGVVQSAVVGREAGHNEEIVAFIETREGIAIDDALLRAHLRAHLSPYKQPGEIRAMAALPSAPNGKVLKGVLKTLAQTPLHTAS
ncbi:AMP-binding protein [Variovorax sp. J22G73]|jgi:acyl-CoA synthetase (AMP-forming)/AMP-acid ligase II|uniref:class I adenylate-forming enzyme family protein n=1 Tax=unclassified Variovorax TaxID=663243 RepID=UPI000D5D00DA|nr:MULTISPECIES: AMP-binding protein [unclassified Variovorax]MDM0003616.1 AMP-binding protein [Variovorax sp. J22R203]MDM0096718.1 AMP-binding protein [Variovorax sp. J22G73]